MIEVVPAYEGEGLEAAIKLSQEYVGWMVGEIKREYPELDLAEFTQEHEYDDVRKKFPGEHVPPDGRLLVARQDGQACGCIALGRLSDAIGEVRTLYVPPAFRGAGVGKVLVEACLAEARMIGYGLVRLDTLGFMEGAQRLYRSFGFYEIEAYLEMSEGLRRRIRFFEKWL
jgi:ribosomal protein S18 acetylase RimI-like enzyme